MNEIAAKGIPTRRASAATLGLEAGLVVCWSSGFIGAILASDTSSVFLVLFWRFVAASLLLLPVTLPYLRKAFGKDLALQALIGALAMFGYLATGIKAIDLGVPAGTAALIAALQPMATAALAGLVIAETVSPRQWAGLLIGLAGVAVAVGGSMGAAPPWAYGLSFASMACIVAATLLSKRAAGSLPLLPTLGVQSGISALLFLALAAGEGRIAPEATPGFAYAVIWFVLLSTVGAYGFYWLCLKRTTATRVASLIYLTPPVTMVWAWLMFGEAIEPAAIAGLALCLCGVWLAARGSGQRRGKG